ncbi:protein NETWORKED 3A-like [Humulus lupulus]|uniref:protein NETWORKED 3A-like n=1 Tax=Humulus lupulus TaxID=3486 RepID=UPI002B40A074|nr:protein NETWORKED 3A-like [Humulus lupulus]XP_062087313.1 protein NETWORKED 3A-like [Humulus lupulus]
MVGIVKNQSSHWWWLDHQSTSKRSPWLQSTLADLDHKTESMLKFIETDADSFAQRAEMYYKKRPELVSMVEEFYRTHRLLAEKYDQVKSDSGTRVVTSLRSPFSSTKYQVEKPVSVIPYQTYDSYSETCDTEDFAESEVDDPELEEDEQECETARIHEETEEVKCLGGIDYEELRKLKEEVERLQEENKAQKDQLKQKDDEKRQVIRQLSMAVDMLKEENLKLRKCLVKDSPKRQSSPFEFNKLKESFLGKMFKNGSPPKYPIVAL